METPRNYEELRRQAIEEMNRQMWSLEARAEAMERFLVYMDSSEKWSPETYESALAVGDIEDYGDHLGLDSLFEIVENWPTVSLEPGEGEYW